MVDGFLYSSQLLHDSASINNSYWYSTRSGWADKVLRVDPQSRIIEIKIWSFGWSTSLTLELTHEYGVSNAINGREGSENVQQD